MTGYNSPSSSQFIMVLGFALIITIPLLTMPFDRDKEISRQEQRRLTAKPEFSWQQDQMKNYSKQFNAYFDDHFGQRNRILSWGNQFKEKVFKRAKAKNVVFGKDNWFFYDIDGSIQDFTGRYQPNQKKLEEWQSGLQFRYEWLQRLGVKYLFVAIPSKAMIYSQYLPNRIESRSGITRLAAFSSFIESENASDWFLDLTPVLKKGSEQQQLYFKTDTHWNDLGAFLGYQAAMSKLKDQLPDLQIVEQTQWNRHEIVKNGDIARIGLESDYLGEPSPALQAKQPCKKLATENVSAFAQTPAYQARPKVLPQRTGCPARKHKAIVIHDSFGQFLKQFLSEQFAEVVYMPAYELVGMEPYIKDYAPDVVIDFRVDRRFHLLLEPYANSKL